MYLRTLELHLCSGGVARRLQERRHWSNTLLLVYWPGTLNCLWILIKLLLYLFFWLRLLNNWRAWSNTMLINFFVSIVVFHLLWFKFSSNLAHGLQFREIPLPRVLFFVFNCYSHCFVQWLEGLCMCCPKTLTV